MNAFTDASDRPLRHTQASSDVRANPLTVFEYIDRPERLSAHMARASWQLAGASMTIDTDADGGRRVGSRMRFSGRMLGIALHVDGEVVRRDSPNSKVWQTIGEPHLFVIGRYRMSVTVEPHDDDSHVTIAIDYAPPARGVARWLGMIFGSLYARWCVQQMVDDLVHRFGVPTT